LPCMLAISREQEGKGAPTSYMYLGIFVYLSGDKLNRIIIVGCGKVNDI